MDALQGGARITFDALSRGEVNRAAQELRQAIAERVGDSVVATIERADADSQDAGAILVLLFGSSAGAAIRDGVDASRGVLGPST